MTCSKYRVGSSALFVIALGIKSSPEKSSSRSGSCVDPVGSEGTRRGAAQIALARQLPHQPRGMRGVTRSLRGRRFQIRAVQLGVEPLERLDLVDVVPG